MFLDRRSFPPASQRSRVTRLTPTENMDPGFKNEVILLTVYTALTKKLRGCCASASKRIDLAFNLSGICRAIQLHPRELSRGESNERSISRRRSLIWRRKANCDGGCRHGAHRSRSVGGRCDGPPCRRRRPLGAAQLTALDVMLLAPVSAGGIRWMSSGNMQSFLSNNSGRTQTSRNRR